MRELPVASAIQHALKSAANNLAVSFHLCLPWLLILGAIDAVLIVVMGDAARSDVQPSQLAMFALYFSIGVTLFAGSSIAVNWHRYILKDEVAQGIARLRADEVVWRYFGNTLLIVAMAFLTVLPGVIVLTLLGAVLKLPQAVAAGFVAVAMMAAIMPLIYRWSLKLPAIALHRTDYTMKHAWNDSVGNHGRLLMVGLAYMAAMLVLGGVSHFVGNFLHAVLGASAAIFDIAMRLAMNWLGTILAATILTSLYGFFVEKREF